MTQIMARPRRSCLYMPGINARALEKAKTLPADMVIMDLEDAVASESKAEARDNIMAKLSEGGYGQREILVRINAWDTPWGADDLAAMVGSGAHGILVPKVQSKDDILALNRALDDHDVPMDFALWVMVEMPLAVVNIADIAAMARGTRLSGLVMGLNDLAKEYRIVPTADRLAFLHAMSAAIAAARGYGLAVIDGVYNDIENLDGLINEAEQGKILGFDGKTVIHPKQLEAVNRIFSPEPAAIQEARDIVAAFAQPDNAGKGVIRVNGKMTEKLHLEQAEQLLAMAEMIQAMYAA